MRRRWRAALTVGLLLAVAPATAAAADPFTLFLLRMLRDQVISSAIESGATSTPPPRAPGAVYGVLPPISGTEGERLRRLIDEGFVHLRPEQRQELHDSLARILDDPKNAAQRGDILTAFTAQAEAMRRSHAQLSRLTEEQMRAVAAEARVEFARLPQDQQREMVQALERGVPGMPRTLHELILVEFRSVAAAR